jgi:hypothetical protein
MAHFAPRWCCFEVQSFRTNYAYLLKQTILQSCSRSQILCTTLKHGWQPWQLAWRMAVLDDTTARSQSKWHQSLVGFMDREIFPPVVPTATCYNQFEDVTDSQNDSRLIFQTGQEQLWPWLSGIPGEAGRHSWFYHTAKQKCAIPDNMTPRSACDISLRIQTLGLVNSIYRRSIPEKMQHCVCSRGLARQHEIQHTFLSRWHLWPLILQLKAPSMRKILLLYGRLLQASCLVHFFFWVQVVNNAGEITGQVPQKPEHASVSNGRCHALRSPLEAFYY